MSRAISLFPPYAFMVWLGTFLFL